MENSHSSWPWKFAAAGAAVSFVFAMLTMIGGWFVHGDSMTGYLWMWATMLISWPAQHLFGVSGWSGPASSFLAMFVTNTVLYALGGAAVGFMLRNARR